MIYDAVDVEIILIKPNSTPYHWYEGVLYNKALKMPHTKIFIDHDYKETNLFGATTSGETFLFDHSGLLKFSGGITIARGHMGDSRGQKLILDWVKLRKSDTKNRSKVFGCSLKEIETNKKMEMQEV